MHKYFLSFIAVLLTTVISSSHAQEDRLQIVASYSILADVIENVTGDAADVTAIMPRGADPHSFVPTPSDLTTLADADVVFINGALFEEGMMEAIENAGSEMNIVTASSCVDVIAFGGHEHEEGDDHEHEEAHDHEEGEDHGESSAIAEICEQHESEMATFHEEDEAHNHENDEEHDHMETLGKLYAVDCGHGHEEEAHDEEEGEEHEHGACDPHVWMNPHNVMYWTMLIRDTLVEMDPTNAETYTTNAATYLETLDEMAHDFIMPMVETVPEESRVLVTNHESLGYFAASYDFELATTIIAGGGTVAEPSAADVAAVIDRVREEGVPAIFAETTVNDQLAAQIAEETGAQVHVLYSGSLSDEDGPASTYLDYMRYNVTTIVEALGGGM